jgi:hypothetical protein
MPGWSGLVKPDRAQGGKMIPEEMKAQGFGSAPVKDWFLQFLVNMANKNKFELDITLMVGGLLISGTLAGVRQYFDNLGAYFAHPFAAAKGSEEIESTFKKIGDQCSCVSPSEQTETPSYVHLKNVRFFDAQGRIMSNWEGVWWRGRISEVQGFSPGILGTPVSTSKTPQENTPSAEG